MFPVHRPSGLKKGQLEHFFPYFHFFKFYSPPPLFFLVYKKKKKKIPTPRLAVFLPTWLTENDFLPKGGLITISHIFREAGQCMSLLLYMYSFLYFHTMGSLSRLYMCLLIICACQCSHPMVDNIFFKNVFKKTG